MGDFQTHIKYTYLSQFFEIALVWMPLDLAYD